MIEYSEKELELEEWINIFGDKLYQISNLGRIKSLPRTITISCKRAPKRTYQEKILEPSVNVQGYKVFRFKPNGTSIKTYQISVLVAIHFLNHTPCGFTVVVDHKDKDKLNDRVSNLQLLTNRANVSKGKLDKPGKTSKYTGVSWFTRGSCWIVDIKIRGKKKRFSNFTNEEEARDKYLSELNNIKE